MGAVTVIGLEGAGIQHVAMGLAYILAALLTSVLHGQNIWKMSMYGESRGMSKRSVITHINFAVASILIVLGAPFSGVSALFGKWIYNDEFCRWYAFEGMFGGMTQIYALVLLCFDRYLAVLYPNLYQKKVIDSLVYFGVLISWMGGFFWAVLPIFGYGSYALEPQGTSCTIDWTDTSESSVTYLSNLVVVAFLWPVGAALVLLILANVFANLSSGDNVSKRQNQLLNYLVFFNMLAWTPFASLTVINLIMPITKISLIAVYTAPLAAKLGVSILPLFYEALIFHKTDNLAGKKKAN